MPLNQHMRENLCKNFCAYFKPSITEDLACEGFVVIEKLLNNGKPIAFDRPATMYEYEMQELLIQAVCTGCSFYKNDCDFILAKLSSHLNNREAKRPLPCGGFILLTHCLESNIIHIDDIRNIL